MGDGGWGTWEKVVDDMLNKAAILRQKGLGESARTLEEGARAIFEANKYEIQKKMEAAKSTMNTAKAAISALEQRAEAMMQFLKSTPKPLPATPVNITALQNKSVMNPKFRLKVSLDPFLIMQVREWLMDYAAYRNGPNFYEEYKSQKQFIDSQWLQYYINGRSSYPINSDGYRRYKSDSFS